MKRAGFVLAGGRSTRMGRDKALLPAVRTNNGGDTSREGGRTLLEQIANCVRDAAGSVVIIGPPERYAFTGFPVIADIVEAKGPLGGICTALRHTNADWNLIVACDMPRIDSELLKRLLDAAEASGKDCLVPSTRIGASAGLEPLCAVYHARVLPAAEDAIHRGRLAMHDFVRSIDAREWLVEDLASFQNVNTPEQYAPAQYTSPQGRTR